ncbi:MAG: tRNA (cytidine(56)-2'-O)-methyltransferase [Candidatus Nanoarchaeia archaeon]|nr:tRNA (cytidine(56)-2'-O)-methyltransferase [Candidatus Nanoarchaeia archaeon]MDD5053954.1 tRNA (cytidine(56)-2'-O)-methyltransferase [Candidatus Nanoarchaeia archaeon]MDD5499297.1 tRNA (cytidine(56)-2'-O)-methyltransferase [Candidatus Nanoarchaeia archaeon]
MIAILRINHRSARDKRISTHIGLVARAFLAEKIIYSGEHDESLIDSVNKIKNEWGGKFSAEYSKDYKKTITEYKNKGFKIAHLTMYGLPLESRINEIKKLKNLLIIVGGEKVPRDVYEKADYNLSITAQPHSEVSALAITLDRIAGGKELSHDFKDAKKRIKPNALGKTFY